MVSKSKRMAVDRRIRLPVPFDLAAKAHVDVRQSPSAGLGLSAANDDAVGIPTVHEDIAGCEILHWAT